MSLESHCQGLEELVGVQCGQALSGDFHVFSCYLLFSVQATWVSVCTHYQGILGSYILVNSDFK